MRELIAGLVGASGIIVGWLVSDVLWLALPAGVGVYIAMKFIIPVKPEEDWERQQLRKKFDDKIKQGLNLIDRIEASLRHLSDPKAIQSLETSVGLMKQIFQNLQNAESRSFQVAQDFLRYLQDIQKLVELYAKLVQADVALFDQEQKKQLQQTKEMFFLLPKTLQNEFQESLEGSFDNLAVASNRLRDQLYLKLPTEEIK